MGDFGECEKGIFHFWNGIGKAQKKINEADQEINKLVTTRTRMLMSKLRKVEQIESTQPEEEKEEDDLFKLQ